MTKVLYRLPEEEVVHELISQKAPLVLENYQDIEGREGFIFTPFVPSVECPILLIEGEIRQRRRILSERELQHTSLQFVKRENREHYHKSFVATKDKLLHSGIEKQVLSRTLQLEFNTQLQESTFEYLFDKACILFPNSFIALVGTEITGYWLVATPEILLENIEDQYRTMALAATMDATKTFPQSPECWSAEYLHEQKIVSNFIARILTDNHLPFVQSPLSIKKAGSIVHLCTDFHFTLSQENSLGELLSQLHPTPAVCGFPLEEAKQSILKIEPHNRTYYSGFLGPVSVKSNHLFVTLRCLHSALNSTTMTLFAGGGLLASSKEENEWIETCRKMETMLKLFT